MQHLMMENLAEGVILAQSDDGTIVYTNKSFEKVFGYNRNELIGKKTSILNAPGQSKTPDEICQMISGFLKKTGEWRGVVRNIRKNGDLIWTEIRTVNLEHSQFGSVNVSIQEDITDRIIAENRIKDSEKRFRILFENSMDAIMILSHDGAGVLEANKAAAELFGRTRIELLNMNRKELVDLSDKRFQKFLKERGVTGRSRGRFVVVKKNGTKVEIEAASVNFVGADGFEQTHIVLHKV